MADRTSNGSGVASNSESSSNNGERTATYDQHNRRRYAGPELAAYRQGFYCALSPGQQPIAAFGEALTELRRRLKEDLDSITDEERRRLQDVEEEAAILAAQEEAEKQACKQTQDEDETGTKQAGDPGHAEPDTTATDLDKKVAALRAEIYKYEADLVDKRAQLVPELLKQTLAAARQNAEAVIDDALLLNRARQKISNETFEASANARGERATWLRAQQALVAATAEPVQRLLSQLEESGLTRATVLFVTSIGVVAQLATGWFFSVFTSSSALDSDDYFSFLIARTLTALDRRFAAADDPTLLAAYLGGWLALLALVGLAVWSVDWLVERRGPDSIELNVDERSVIANMRQASLFGFVVHLLPIAFVGGLGFILLSFFGPRGDDVSRLMRSLSGQFVGSTMALLTTALFVVYMALVVRPRLTRMAPGTPAWRHHIELVVGLLAPLCFVCILVLWEFVAPTGATNGHSTTALAWFLVAMLLTSPTLGYGIWARGIYAEAGYYERLSFQFNARLTDCLQPQHLNTTPLDSRTFKEAWEERCARLLHLAEGTDTPPLQTGRFALFSSRGTTDTSAFDSAHLPDLKHRLDDLRSDLEALQAQRRDAADLLGSAQGGGHSNLEGTKRAPRSLVQLRQDRINAIARRRSALDEVQLVFRARENALRDGFDLGCWYARLNGSFLNQAATMGEA